MAAARGGDLNAVLAVLDPDVVLRADLNRAWDPILDSTGVVLLQ